MNSKSPFVRCGFVLILVTSVLTAQDKQKTKSNGLHIESLMTAAEFKSCGLNKLSEEEIAQLDAWLTKTIANAATDSKPSKPVTTNVQDVIESEIEGDFKGWDGETVFKLTNGQIWQQVEYDYEYEYAYRPKVLIYNTAGGYKMKVEGMDDTIYVKRLK